jgi:hypothetical protein
VSPGSGSVHRSNRPPSPSHRTFKHPLTARHWYYEDNLRPINPQLPAMGQEAFSRLILETSPLLTDSDSAVNYRDKWEAFVTYKGMVPVCGGVLLNETWDKVGSLAMV